MATKPAFSFRAARPAALLSACGERLDIEVKARIDGQPAAQAKVIVDARRSRHRPPKACSEAIRKRLRRDRWTVSKEMPGYRSSRESTSRETAEGGPGQRVRVEADLKPCVT